MNNEEYKKKYQQQLQLLRRIWLEEYQKPDTANIEQTIQALIKSLEEKEKEKEREAQVYHQQLEQKEKEKAEKEQEIKKIIISYKRRIGSYISLKRHFVGTSNKHLLVITGLLVKMRCLNGRTLLVRLYIISTCTLL